MPDDLKKKYFTKVGNSYQISDEIKKRVEFKEHDLLKDPYPGGCNPVSYTHLRAHETRHDLVCRLLLEKKKYITTVSYTHLRAQRDRPNGCAVR